MKVLLNSFHLNCHTLWFHPQTQKVQPYLLTQGLTLGSERVKFRITKTDELSVNLRER